MADLTGKELALASMIDLERHLGFEVGFGHCRKQETNVVDGAAI